MRRKYKDRRIIDAMLPLVASGLPDDQICKLVGVEPSRLKYAKHTYFKEIQVLYDDQVALDEALKRIAMRRVMEAIHEGIDALRGDTKPATARDLQALSRMALDLDKLSTPKPAKPSPDATPGIPKAGGLGARGKG